jgi:Fe-S-cluster containining protein
MSVLRYECDKCAACCKALIIEISHLDVVREPKILPVVTLLDGNGKIQYDSDWEKQYSLACGQASPCGLLGADNLCTIYLSRPNCCVGMQAGDDQCQMARGVMGLPWLEPLKENV